MHLRTFFALALTALSVSSADAQYSVPHAHRYDYPGDQAQQERNAQADFFMAMYFLSQCRVNMARTWLGYARGHDPGNPEYVIAEMQFEQWRKEESRKTLSLARTWKSADLSEYYYAQRCDPDNKEIAKEIELILSDRSPPRERKFR